jgi:hypothetical protein
MPKDFKPFSAALDVVFDVEEGVSNRPSLPLSAATDEVFNTEKDHLLYGATILWGR